LGLVVMRMNCTLGAVVAAAADMLLLLHVAAAAAVFLHVTGWS
jgi:hypothetical protein